MKRSEFEKIVKEEGFDEAINEASIEIEGITSCDILKEFAQYKLNEDNVFLASHILDALTDGDYFDGCWRYDFSMGTLETPTPVRTIEDIEDLLED